MLRYFFVQVSSDEEDVAISKNKRKSKRKLDSDSEEGKEVKKRHRKESGKKMKSHMNDSGM